MCTANKFLYVVTGSIVVMRGFVELVTFVFVLIPVSTAFQHHMGSIHRTNTSRKPCWDKDTCIVLGIFIIFVFMRNWSQRTEELYVINNRINYRHVSPSMTVHSLRSCNVNTLPMYLMNPKRSNSNGTGGRPTESFLVHISNISCSWISFKIFL